MRRGESMRKERNGIVSTAVVWSLGVLGACSSGGNATTASACDKIFDSIYLGCFQPVPPASELSRFRQRYEQVCEQGLALPGVSLSADELSSCVSQVAG